MRKYMHDEVLARLTRLLKDRRIRVAAAESCTGGNVAAALTSVAGASVYFCCGVTAYSADVKVKLLNVMPETISEHGVISAKTADEMRRGVLALSGADIAVATTGIAGPDGCEGKPVGRVYISAGGEHSETREFNFTGDRHCVVAQAAAAALDMLERAVLGLSE